MNYLLDTNIVLIYASNSPIADFIEDRLALFSKPNNLFASVVTVAEIESLIIQRQYGDKKKAAFRELLDSLAIIDVNIQEIIQQYAEIDAFSQGKNPNKPSTFSSRNMGKNDLWIAATSSHYKLILVSTDQDFNHLKDAYIELEYIDLEKLRV